MNSTARPLVIAIAFAASLIFGLLIVFWAMGGVQWLSHDNVRGEGFPPVQIGAGAEPGKRSWRPEITW